MKIDFQIAGLTLAQALPIKNLLAGWVKTLGSRVQQNNSHVVNNAPPYDSKLVLKEYDAAVAKLIALKAAIAAANVKINTIILTRDELKARKAILESTKAYTGKMANYASDPVVYDDWVCEITQVDIDNEIQDMQAQIMVLQGQLDQYNFTTKLE